MTAFRAQIEELAPVGPSPDLFKNLLNHYTWVGVCLFFGSFANSILGTVLGPVVSAMIGGGAMFGFSLLLAPYLIIDVVPTKMEGSDDDKRLVNFFVFQLLVSYCF